jgi:hypothetical protein
MSRGRRTVPRSINGATVHQRNAEAAAIDAEDRIPGGDAQIAPQCEFETTCDGMAFDRGDDRFAEQHPGTSERTVAVGNDAIAAITGHCFKISSRAKGAARAGQNRDTERVVGVEAAKGLRKGVGSRAVNGVAGFGTIDSDGRNQSLDVEFDLFHYKPPS